MYRSNQFEFVYIVNLIRIDNEFVLWLYRCLPTSLVSTRSLFLHADLFLSVEYRKSFRCKMTHWNGKKERTSHKRRLQHKLIYVSHLLKYCSHTISIALCDFVLWKLIDPRTRFIQLTCQLCREILTNDLATHLLCHTNVQCAGCMHTKHQMTLFININLERQIEWTERKVWTRQFAMEQIYFDMEHANTHTHTQMKETLSEYIVFDAMTLC